MFALFCLIAARGGGRRGPSLNVHFTLVWSLTPHHSRFLLFVCFVDCCQLLFCFRLRHYTYRMVHLLVCFVYMKWWVDELHPTWCSVSYYDTTLDLMSTVKVAHHLMNHPVQILYSEVSTCTSWLNCLVHHITLHYCFGWAWCWEFYVDDWKCKIVALFQIRGVVGQRHISISSNSSTWRSEYIIVIWASIYDIEWDRVGFN